MHDNLCNNSNVDETCVSKWRRFLNITEVELSCRRRRVGP